MGGLLIHVPMRLELFPLLYVFHIRFYADVATDLILSRLYQVSSSQQITGFDSRTYDFMILLFFKHSALLTYNKRHYLLVFIAKFNI